MNASVAAIQAAWEQSTGGLWDTDADGVSISLGEFKTANICFTGMGADKIDDRYYQAIDDAKFIALVHEEWPDVLAYIRQLEAQANGGTANADAGGS